MDDPKRDRAPDTTKPTELDATELDNAAGGWGRSCYTSYSGESSASFTARSSDKGGSSS